MSTFTAKILYRAGIKAPAIRNVTCAAGLSGRLSTAALNNTTATSTTHQGYPLEFQSRAFHSSSPTAFRRRRRGGAPPSTEESAKNDSSSDKFVVRDPKLFKSQAQKLLDKVQMSLRPLKQYNDPFLLLRSRDPSIPGEYIVLDLGKEIVDGEFQILMDYDTNLLVFTTPVSGQYIYQLMMPKSAKSKEKEVDLDDDEYDDDDIEKLMKAVEPTGEWVSTQDGHSFEGMLVRDFIRVAKGVPKF